MTNSLANQPWVRRDWVCLVAVIVAAAGLRVAYVLQLQACPFFTHEIMDALYHDQWARAIVEGRTFQEGAYFRAPLYPWFLSLIYQCSGGSTLAARMVQGLLGSLSCGLVFLLGRLLFTRGVALAAGIAAASYWVLICFDAELLIPVLLVFFDLALLVSLELGRRRDHIAWWFLSGLMLGLSAIAWPLVLLFAPLAALWMLLIHRGKWGRAGAALGVFGLGCMMPILPVSLLNARAGDRVLIATQGGVNFFIGNNPQSDGFTAIVPGTRPDWWGGYHDSIARAEESAGRKLKGSEVSDYYYAEAFRFFREQPRQAFGLVARKLLYFWSWHEIPNNKDDKFVAERFAPFVRWLPLGFWIVGPLGALGLLLCLREPVRYMPMCGFVLVSMAGVVTFFVTGRYRVPVVPPLILLAVVAVSWLVRSVAARRAGPVGGAAVVLAAMGLVTARTPAGSGMHAAEMLISMGRVLVDSGEADAALPYFHEAVEREPDNAKAAYALGFAEQRRGRLGEAADWYGRAIALAPDYAEAHNNLGILHYDRREFDAAIERFHAAIQADDAHAPAYVNLGRAYEAQGRTDEALAAYRQGLDLNGENIDGWIRAILLSGRAGRNAGTLELAERAAAASGRGDARILDLLAEAQFLSGKVGDALASVEAAITAARASGDEAMVRQIEGHRRSFQERRAAP